MSSSEMASPQLEHGYTKIANEILEALARTSISTYQSRVLWAIFRKTYGFGKKVDKISLSQLSEMTGIQKAHVGQARRELIARKILTVAGEAIGFNKNHAEWCDLETYRRRPRVRQSDTGGAPIRHLNPEDAEITQKEAEMVRQSDTTGGVRQSVSRGAPIRLARVRQSDTTKENTTKENIQKKNFLSTISDGDHPDPPPEPKPKKSKTFLSDSDEIRLGEFFVKEIQANNPNFKQPNLQVWAKDFDLMIRRDNRTPKQIAELIRWCQKDPFQMAVVLSPKKLRARFDELWMKMHRNGNGRNGEYKPTPYERRCQEVFVPPPPPTPEEVKRAFAAKDRAMAEMKKLGIIR